MIKGDSYKILWTFLKMSTLCVNLDFQVILRDLLLLDRICHSLSMFHISFFYAFLSWKDIMKYFAQLWGFVQGIKSSLCVRIHKLIWWCLILHSFTVSSAKLTLWFLCWESWGLVIDWLSIHVLVFLVLEIQQRMIQMSWLLWT